VIVKGLASALCVCLLLATGVASAATEMEPRLRKKIEQLMELTGARSVGEQISEAVTDQMVRAMTHASPETPARVFEIVAESSRQILQERSQELFDRLVPLYALYYDESDLDVLIAFYSTPTGRKVIETMPELMRDSMQIGSQWGQSIVPLLQDAIRRRLSQENIVLP
jgi:hypothetical protein